MNEIIQLGMSVVSNSFSLQLARVSVSGSTAVLEGGWGSVFNEEEKGALMWQILPYLLDSENLKVGGMLLECDLGWGLSNFNSYL